MLEATRKLIEQIATWDAIEEVWDIHIPMPSYIRQETGLDAHGCIEVSLEFHEWSEENGVDYSFTHFDGDIVVVQGIALAQCV